MYFLLCIMFMREMGLIESEMCDTTNIGILNPTGLAFLLVFLFIEDNYTDLAF